MSLWRMKQKSTLLLHDGVHAFYLNALLRAMVFGLVRIFVPVFVYRLGLLWWGDGRYALITVAVYYLILRFIVLLLSIPISKIIERIGFRRSVAVSVFFLIIEMFGLFMARDNV